MQIPQQIQKKKKKLASLCQSGPTEIGQQFASGLRTGAANHHLGQSKHSHCNIGIINRK
jgi:hypothetical protein